MRSKGLALALALLTGVLLMSSGCSLFASRPAVMPTPLPVKSPPVVSTPPPAADPAPPAKPPTPEEKLVPYNGTAEHIFFHPLIAYPERAFDGDSLSQGYNDWFNTVPEFNKILDALYRNGYVLIDIRSLYEETSENGKSAVHRNQLLLPEGKKPLILSIDDMNYYDYMRENGNVSRLVVDDQGRVATESVNLKGETVIRYDNDIVPILDAFVAAHPDFSFHGAKGLIALTGYEGILGYRTQNAAGPNYEREKAGALKVVKRLKETGWTFASHGWGHLDAAKISYDRFVQDTTWWLQDVGSLIGETPVYVYPFGSAVGPSDPKFKFLQEHGFRVMCGVGPPYLEIKPGYVLMDRRHIDGLALHSQRQYLLPLFDSDQIIDPIRPKQY